MYATLKSDTCPQCFAKLTEVDDETAAEMTAARAELEKSPEYQQAKAEEDEIYRHQSFQACLTGLALGVGVLILAVVLIVTARRHEHAAARLASRPPSVVPVATQASAVDVMPAIVDGYRREKVDTPTALSGTVTLIYHAAYAAGKTGTVDVYAITGDRPAAELDRFRDVVNLTAMAGAAQRPVMEVNARPFLYEIIGAPGPSNVNADFRRAWASQVAGQ